jgi:hypothetical protein
MTLRYVPYGELGEERHVIMDGAANPRTALTLSHWPRSGTPAALKQDLSAQIAFRYLERPELHPPVAIVSNDHFDQDGLVGIYALVEPEAARAHEALLVDVAAAGDFATYRSRNAARATFALAAFADRALSPLDPALFRGPYGDLVTALYTELLPRLPELLAHPERFRRYWEDEDAFLAASEAAIASGRVTIEELPALDLAIVTLPDGAPPAPAHRFAVAEPAACHPMAIHNATGRLRILLVRGRRYELQFRYETWVQYVSARPMPRVDLAPLAERLSELEGGVRVWVFDGVGRLTPRLRLADGGESDLAPERFRQEVLAFLDAAPPAWDPYDAA